MILIVGATGTLGGHVARQLLAQGHQVRAMTRDVTRATALASAGADVVQGDLRDVASIRAAMKGVRAVVSASHAILGTGRGSSARIDDEGQRDLIAAAKDAGVAHFVYTSALGAAADHPVDFWQTKARIEQVLISSGLPYTIIRPSMFMEMYAFELIGKAVVTGKRVVLFGPGNNPKNFVAASDVAELIVLALTNERLRGETLEIGGPENLTSHEVVDTFERLSGRSAKITHVPLAALRGFSRALRPVHQGVSRILQTLTIGETTDLRFDPAPLLARVPLRLTRLEEWAQSRSSTRRGPEIRPLPPALAT